MTTQEPTTELNAVDRRDTWLDEFCRSFDGFFQSGNQDRLFLLPRPRTGKGVVLWLLPQTVSLSLCSEDMLKCMSLKPIADALVTDDRLHVARLVATLHRVHGIKGARTILSRAASTAPDDDLPHLSRP